MERISCFMICLWALFFKTLGQIDENKVTRFVLSYSKTHDLSTEAVRSILDSCAVYPRNY